MRLAGRFDAVASDRSIWPAFATLNSVNVADRSARDNTRRRSVIALTVHPETSSPVTSEAFPNERDDTQGCRFNATPEDSTNLAVSEPTNSPGVGFLLGRRQFRGLHAPAGRANSGRSDQYLGPGSNQFINIGCGRCHIPQHTTGQSPFGGQSQVTISPLSDFALHNMGTGLQDQVNQGAANGQQFRTAPLWGVGQRVFFLHGGRTNNLVTAIQAHASAGSEANQVINNFNLLSPSDRQAIIVYLRSL